ncbi:MAG: cytochrome c biogenesis protein CcsA [Acidobacteria bacterium]|nr:cytochrome c biogenesis protein CcsA [Acidobacteriota bacterium]
MTSILDYLVLAFYAVSLGLHIWYLYTDSRLVGRLGTVCLAGGVVSHYFALLSRARAVGSVPYQDLYGSMSLFAWLLAVTYLGIERFHRQRAVAPFILPFVIAFASVSTFLAPAAEAVHRSKAYGPLFALHVTVNILAYAAFALSFVVSLLYLAQNRWLRHRRLGTVIWRFPALEVLERMSRSSVIVGVSALSFGILFGFIWARRLLGQYITGDPKEIVSLLVLLVYATYLWLSRKTAWRGARACRLCVASFFFVIFSYTVVNFYLSSYHRFF